MIERRSHPIQQVVMLLIDAIESFNHTIGVLLSIRIIIPKFDHVADENGNKNLSREEPL